MSSRATGLQKRMYGYNISSLHQSASQPVSQSVAFARQPSATKHFCAHHILFRPTAIFPTTSLLLNSNRPIPRILTPLLQPSALGPLPTIFLPLPFLVAILFHVLRARLLLQIAALLDRASCMRLADRRQRGIKHVVAVHGERALRGGAVRDVLGDGMFAADARDTGIGGFAGLGEGVVA